MRDFSPWSQARLFALSGMLLLTGCGAVNGPPEAPSTTVMRKVRSLPANALRIHWKDAALVPALRAGHVCIVTYKTGHVCAKYSFGQLPAVALKEKLREEGWVVLDPK